MHNKTIRYQYFNSYNCPSSHRIFFFVKMTFGYWRIGLGLGSNWLLLWRSRFVLTWLWERLLVPTFQKMIPWLSRKSQQLKTEAPNLGDARGLNSVIFWVHLYQWGDAIDVRGDADTKRLRTPGLKSLVSIVSIS